MSQHLYADRVSKVINLLVDRPRTIVELCQELGLPVTDSHRYSIGRILRSLSNHKLVRIVGTREPTGRGGRGWLWAWARKDA